MRSAPWPWQMALWTVLFVALVVLVQRRLLAPLDEAGLRLVVETRPDGLAEAMNWIFRLGFAQVGAGVALLWSAWLLVRHRRMAAASEMPARGAPGGARLLPVSWLAPLTLFAVMGLEAGLRLVVDQPVPSTAYELPRPFARQPVEAVLDRTDAAARETFAALVASVQGPGPAEGGSGVAGREGPVAPAAPARPATAGRGAFPSGHAVRTLFLALLAWPRAGGPLPRLGLLVLVGLVGYSTMYFGYHWPSDVLGGFLLALAALPLADRLRQAPGVR